MDIEYSSERKAVEEFLNLIDDVYGGNYFIKKDVQKYLRKAPGEETDAYNSRAKIAVFYNFLKPIIRLASERPFSNKVTYSENFPKEFDTLKTNFDGLGNGLLFKAFETFSLGIKHAFVGVASDYDNEEKKPFARIIPARDIIGIWKKVNSDGSYYYERVQFIVRSISVEEVYSPLGVLEGFKEVNRAKIIELIHPNIMRTYPVDKEKTMKNGFAFEVNPDLSTEETLDKFKKIPFHLFTTEQPIDSQSTIKIIPTFYDLSLINLSHYNKQSDQDNIMTVSRYAILTASGVTETDMKNNFKPTGKKEVLGPFTFLLFENPNAKLGFAEHTGKAIEAGQNDIIKTEKSMISLLKDYLQRQVIMETATEKNIAEKHQNLYTIYLANKLEQVLTKVFMDFATYMGIEIKDTESLISFSRDYSAAETAKKIEAIIKAREIGDLSTESFLSQLSSLNVFSGDFDPKAETERIAREAGENIRPPNNNEPNVFDENAQNNTGNKQENNQGNNE